MTGFLRYISIFFTVVFLCTPHQLWAASQSDWVEFEHSKFRLLSRSADTGVENQLWLAVEIRLNKGWKTYWRTPGRVGQPLTIDHEGSKNVKKTEIFWPTPARFESFDIESMGYKGNIVLPVLVTLENKGQPLDAKFYIDYLICEKTCVPYSGEVKLSLPKGSGQNTVFTQLIDTSLAKVPVNTGKTPHFEVLSARVDAKAKKLSVEFNMLSQKDNPNLLVPDTVEDVFIEGPEDVHFEHPKFRYLSQTSLAVTFDIVMDDPADTLIGEYIQVTAHGRGDSIETRRIVLPAAPKVEQNFFVIMGLAIIGGFILNLMPCVLPVLSIKLLSVVSHAGQEKRKIRIGFLVSSLGIISSFWLLAAITLSLKFFGSTVGWGTQYQQPAFIITMVVILMAFACNLWGLFEIVLPHKANNALNTLFAPKEENLINHFVSGAFATLLATPCSAPFLGTAVGFALSKGPFEIFIIFTMLGIGLAIPYIMVALYPNIAALLPRPGNWMVTLRRVLGVFLFVTGLWFLSVLVSEIGLQNTLLVSIGIFTVIIYLWYRRIFNSESENFFGTLSMISICFSVFLVYITAFEKPTADEIVDGVWKPFNEKNVEQLVKKGEIVFVNVTADWCVTCKFNESLVLSKASLIKTFEKNKVVPIRADWTNHDKNIADFLAQYDRFGIPFNVVFGPAAPQGIILPELLTTSDVLEALSKASGEPKDWTPDQLI